MKNLFAFMMLAQVLFTACINEDAPMPDEGKTVTICATIAGDADSRIALGETDEKKVNWTFGDKIALIINETDYEFTWQEATTFKYTGTEELPELVSGTITAKYPATDADVDYSNQPGTKNGVTQFMTLAGSTSVAEGQDYSDLSITFSHNTSVVKMMLTNDAFKTKEVSVSLHAVGLPGNKMTVTEPLSADSQGEVTVYFVIPVTSEMTMSDAEIFASCDNQVLHVSLGSKELVPGKLYKVTRDMEIAYEVESDDTWNVLSATGLRMAAQEVNSGNTSLNITLGADIDMDSENWVPIGGNMSTPYTGTFYGAGYRISNLKMENFGGACWGLIGYNEGSVSDVELSGLFFSGDGSVGVGGIAGRNSGGTIQRCAVYDGMLKGDDFYHLGGVVGRNADNGKVIACLNTSALQGFSDEMEGFVTVGGIVGYNTGNSTVENCLSWGQIKGGAYVGGVVGYGDGGSSIKNSYYLNSAGGSGTFGGNAVEKSDLQSQELEIHLGEGWWRGGDDYLAIDYKRE